MKTKHTLSVTILGSLLVAAAPAVSHAESQTEWFLKQQQMTDGYASILDDPSYRAYLRWNGFPDPRPAAPSHTDKDAPAKSGHTGMGAEGKAGATITEGMPAEGRDASAVGASFREQRAQHEGSGGGGGR